VIMEICARKIWTFAALSLDFSYSCRCSAKCHVSKEYSWPFKYIYCNAWKLLWVCVICKVKVGWCSLARGTFAASHLSWITTLNPPADLFKHEPFSTPWGVYDLLSWQKFRQCRNNLWFPFKLVYLMIVSQNNRKLNCRTVEL
jgi:hypothetical protein